MRTPISRKAKSRNGNAILAKPCGSSNLKKGATPKRHAVMLKNDTRL
jgi:hypothetical protein